MFSNWCRVVLALAGVVLLVAGCAPADAARAGEIPAGGGQDSQELVVFAASSLTGAFEAIAGEYQRENPGTSIVFNFGGSSQLRYQLENGAHADVFASADEKQMDLARRSGLIAGEPEVFAGNELALVVPSTNPAGISGLADLAKPGAKLVLAAPDVPAGAYARQAIAAMGRSGQFGSGFEQRALANVVSQEENVKRVLAKVQMGEADAGFVYASDTKGAAGVTAIPIPGEFQEKAKYLIAMIKGARRPDAAGAFVRYVLGDQGRSVLVKYGFTAQR